MIAYVVFSASQDKEYSYSCGGLRPSPGDLVVVQVGKDNSLKIVKCVRISDEEDRMAYKEIYAILQLQPRKENGK